MTDFPTSPEATARPSLANRVRLPRLSGKASAVWLVICFVLTAVLIPLVLRLPRWIEFEIVVGVWWVIWFAVLATILYRGQRVTDDHQFGQPRKWFSSDASGQPARSGDPNAAWWDGFFWGWFWDDAVLVVLGLIVLLGLIWLLVEIAVPILLFMLYFLARGMLARVVNDRHRCKGNVPRALGWGFTWATAYTAPLAMAVWLIHFAHQHGRA